MKQAHLLVLFAEKCREAIVLVDDAGSFLQSCDFAGVL
jgi:hypothetical protein